LCAKKKKKQEEEEKKKKKITLASRIISILTGA